jgi:hypothetical protein
VPTTPYVNARTGEVQQIPAGVHPAFHYPPGGRRGSLVQHLVDKLEAAPAVVARSAIADLVQGEAFPEWYRKPAGGFPLALLEPEAAGQLGAKVSVVVFSEQNLAEQLRKQAAIVIEDYALVQQILDTGTPFRQADGSLLFRLEQADGSALLLTVERSGVAVVVRSLVRVLR